MWAFHRYFLHYLFFARTRQGILFLALVGLFLSSFALCVVQGVMGGLQRGLVERSKTHMGHGVLIFREEASGEEPAWLAEAQAAKLHPVRELEVELLIRQAGQVAPLVLHGVDYARGMPPFLQHKELDELVLGAELGQKIRATFYTDVLLIAPATTESLMGELPRSLGASVSDFVLTDVAELDAAHGWVRLSMVQNLLRTRSVNRWRFFDAQEFARAQELFGERAGVTVRSWEAQNSTLVWALNLETRVMLALFISMSLLVALAIITGFMLFFALIRTDLASFWILGFSLDRLRRLCLAFILQLTGLTCLIGTVAGLGLLWLLGVAGQDLMPDIFVERSLPVEFSPLSISISFVVPFCVASVFSLVSFAQFRRENQTFINLVRGAGQAG